MPPKVFGVTRRYVALRVVIPSNKLGDLVDTFGQEFKSVPKKEGDPQLMACVDDYRESEPGVVHVLMRVNAKSEAHLEDFLFEFAQRHGIDFRC